jgi:hypothetical protein
MNIRFKQFDFEPAPGDVFVYKDRTFVCIKFQDGIQNLINDKYSNDNIKKAAVDLDSFDFCYWVEHEEFRIIGRLEIDP